MREFDEFDSDIDIALDLLPIPNRVIICSEVWLIFLIVIFLESLIDL